MKKKYYWTIWRHLILSLIITCTSFISELISGRMISVKVLASILRIIKPFSNNEAASIGIIGGSDGPTTIFLGSAIGPLFMVYPHVILFVILLVLYLPLKIYVDRVLKSQDSTDNI